MRPVVSHADEERLVVHGPVLQELDGEVRVLDVRQRTARYGLEVYRTHSAVGQLAVRLWTDLGTKNVRVQHAWKDTQQLSCPCQRIGK